MPAPVQKRNNKMTIKSHKCNANMPRQLGNHKVEHKWCNVNCLQCYSSKVIMKNHNLYETSWVLQCARACSTTRLSLLCLLEARPGNWASMVRGPLPIPALPITSYPPTRPRKQSPIPAPPPPVYSITSLFTKLKNFNITLYNSFEFKINNMQYFYY